MGLCFGPVLRQVGFHFSLHLVVNIDFAIHRVIMEEGDDLPDGNDGV